MRPVSIRKGFATNSSSSHSIILTEKQLVPRSPQWDAFGWDDFTLTTPEAKAEYVAAAAYHYYTQRAKVGEEEAAHLCNAAFGIEWAVTRYEEADIDHQSEPTFPEPRLSEQGMSPLWRWIRKHIVNRSGVTILGGNDNSDGHPDWYAGPEVDVPWEREDRIDTGDGLWHPFGGTYLWDDQGYLVRFDKRNGTRLRYALEDGEAPAFSSVPELVDVKITGYCQESCKFCYQDSGMNGNHADIGDLQSLAYSLGRMGVFEVALGGGEPTLHPAFPEVLEVFADVGIVPNFSTRNEKFARSSLIEQAVREYVGAFALSIEQSYGVFDAKRMAESLGKPPTVHVVLGTCNEKDLFRIFETCNKERVRLVLLGYKGGLGRAPEQPPDKIGEWLKAARDSGLLNSGLFAVDSFLAGELAANIPEADPRTYDFGDGRFSCYYDAVTGKIAEHSFVRPEEQDAVSPYRVEDWWRKRHGIPEREASDA